MADRYDTNGIPEGQFQPGSNDQVLLNKPGITETSAMDDVELATLRITCALALVGFFR